MKRVSIYLALTLVMALNMVIAPGAFAAEADKSNYLLFDKALMIKTGTFDMSKKSQTFAGGLNTFDTESDGVFAVEFEFRRGSGFAWGFELISYDNDFTQGSLNGTADTFIALVTAKKYFRPGKKFSPFIGIGVGGGSTSLSGDFTGSGGDIAIAFGGGFELRWKRVGLYVEYKQINTKPEDDFGTNINVGGDGIFVGLAAYF